MVPKKYRMESAGCLTKTWVPGYGLEPCGLGRAWGFKQNRALAVTSLFETLDTGNS